MAMEMALRAPAAVRPTLPPAATSPRTSPSISKLIPKSHCRPTSVSLPTSITLSLVGLLSPPDEAKALSLPKEQIVSSLSEASSHTPLFFFQFKTHLIELLRNKVFRSTASARKY